MNPITGEQKLLAILAHTAYFFGDVGLIIAPLILMILKKENDFVYHHAKQALIAHLTLLIASLIVSLLCVALVGVLLIPILIILWILLIVTSLIASFYVLDGKLYYYPFIQKIVAKF